MADAAAATALQAELDAAAALGDARGDEAAARLRAVVLDAASPCEGESLKVKERALDALIALLVRRGDAAALRGLLPELRPLFAAVPKAKTARVVRAVVDAIGRVPGSQALLLEVVREQVAWAAEEKRTFLRQRLELRLAGLLAAAGDVPAALALTSKLLSEVKRLDDKLLLVDVHLLESRLHHAVRSLPRARAALTAARAAANAVYVPPSAQADLDAQSGALHAEEGDFRTAFSYFYEAFEALAALDDAPRARAALKHLLLCKVMAGDAAEVPALAAAKGGLKLAGPDVDAMRAVAAAYADRSLAGFQAALRAHEPQLGGDPVVAAHLARLYDTMLEKNLLRVAEPYSRVEVAHLAALVGLPAADVEAKLSQMILDRALAGTLDQGAGTLEVFGAAPADGVYPAALGAFESMARAVESLHARAVARAAAPAAA